MPGAILLPDWGVKPSHPGEIDWDHPQAQGIKIFHLLNQLAGPPLDIAGGRLATVIGSPAWGPTPGGIGRGPFGTAAYDAIDPPQQVLGVTFPCFMAAGFCNTNVSAIGTVVSQSSTASTFPMVMITVNSDTGAVLAVGAVWFRLRDQIGTQVDFLANPASFGININDGQPHSVAIRALSASSYEGWVDGILMGTSTTTLGAMTCERYSLGVLHRSSVTQPFLGQVLWHMAGYGASPDMPGIARTPYAAILTPWVRRYYGLASSNTFSYSPSGGLLLGGSATRAATFAPAPTGGLLLGGSASPPSVTFAPAPSGGVVIGGTATRTVAFAANPSGGLLLGGSAPGSINPTFSVTPSGGLLLGGAATIAGSNSFSYSPSGGLLLGGAAFTVYHATQTPYRDRDVYLAIKALLKSATHDGKPAFDRVTLGKPAYAQRIKSDDASWVDIQPLSDGTTTAGSPSREFHRPSFVLTIGVRDTDDAEATYSSRLDRLTAIVRNTLLSPANRTFGGLVLSGYTKLSDGSIGASGYPGMTRTLHGEFAYEVSLASSGYSTVF